MLKELIKKHGTLTSSVKYIEHQIDVAPSVIPEIREELSDTLWHFDDPDNACIAQALLLHPALNFSDLPELSSELQSFLDSDDAIHPETRSYCVSAIERAGYLLAITKATRPVLTYVAEGMEWETGWYAGTGEILKEWKSVATAFSQIINDFPERRGTATEEALGSFYLLKNLLMGTVRDIKGIGAGAPESILEGTYLLATQEDFDIFGFFDGVTSGHIKEEHINVPDGRKFRIDWTGIPSLVVTHDDEEADHDTGEKKKEAVSHA